MLSSKSSEEPGDIAVGSGQLLLRDILTRFFFRYFFINSPIPRRGMERRISAAYKSSLEALVKARETLSLP